MFVFARDQQAPAGRRQSKQLGLRNKTLWPDTAALWTVVCLFSTCLYLLGGQSINIQQSSDAIVSDT